MRRESARSETYTPIHMFFPDLDRSEYSKVIELHARGMRNMRDICYYMNCNIYSVFCALHPGHEKLVREDKIKHPDNFNGTRCKNA